MYYYVIYPLHVWSQGEGETSYSDRIAQSGNRIPMELLSPHLTHLRARASLSFVEFEQ
jgi:hypothetical protein